MNKIQPLPKKTQSLSLPAKTGFYFIPAAGESLLKVSANESGFKVCFTIFSGDRLAQGNALPHLFFGCTWGIWKFRARDQTHIHLRLSHDKHQILNHQATRKLWDCVLLTKACFLEGWPPGDSDGPQAAVVQNSEPLETVQCPQSLSPPCSALKLLGHTSTTV